MQSGTGALGGFFFIIWLVMMIGMIVGYVIILIAVWRAMKAHESIAQTLKDYLQFKKQKAQKDSRDS